MATENVRYILSLRDRFSKNMKTANNTVARLDASTKDVNRSLINVRNTLATIGVAKVIKSIAGAGIEMEQTQVAFATFLRSGEKATKVISQLNEFSNVTPFNNAEVIKSGRILLAANVPAERLTNILKSIGDVAAGSKVPLTELSSIYSKILNKGKVQAEELNQLAERGIPILQVLADQYGVTKQEVFKMASASQISSNDISQAFQKMTSDGGIFFNLMQKQSRTTGGLLSTLRGKAELLGAELGKKMLPIIKSIAEKLISFADVLRRNQDIIVSIVKLAAKLTAAFVAYKVTILAANKAAKLYTIAQKTMFIANVLFTKGLKKAQQAMKIANITMKANPIGLIVSGITLLLPLLSKLYTNMTKVSVEQQVINDVNQKAIRNAASQTAGLKILEKRIGRLNKENKVHQERLKRLDETHKLYNSTVDKVNANNKERSNLINQINSQYGSYLQNLLTEKATDEEIANAMKKINEQVLLRAKLIAIQEKITEVTKNQLENELLLRDQEALKQKASNTFLGHVSRIFDMQNATNTTALNEERIRKNINKEIKRGDKSTEALLNYQQEIENKLKESGINAETLNKNLSTPISKNIDAKVTGDLEDKELKKETRITASAPKMITVNIGNVIETFNLETKVIKEAPIRVKEAVARAIMDGVNDYVLAQK